MYKVKNARAELFFRSNLVPMAFPLPGGGAPHPQVREKAMWTRLVWLIRYFALPHPRIRCRCIQLSNWFFFFFFFFSSTTRVKICSEVPCLVRLETVKKRFFKDLTIHLVFEQVLLKSKRLGRYWQLWCFPVDEKFCSCACSLSVKWPKTCKNKTFQWNQNGCSMIKVYCSNLDYI